MDTEDRPFIHLETQGQRNGNVHIYFGERMGDPQPFILIVTPSYVAQKTSKTLPINIVEVQTYVSRNIAELRATALRHRTAGYTTLDL